MKTTGPQLKKYIKEYLDIDIELCDYFTNKQDHINIILKQDISYSNMERHQIEKLHDVIKTEANGLHRLAVYCK